MPIEECFENKRKNLHEAHTKEVNAHYEKMNADSLHHQKLYNDAMKENKSNEELKKLNDAHNESHLKNQEDLKALHNRHDSERSALIKEYSEARRKIKEGSSKSDDKQEEKSDEPAPLTTAQASTVGKVIANVLRKSAHGLARDKAELHDNSVANKKIKTHLSEKSLLGPYIHTFQKDGSEIKYTGRQGFGTYQGDEPGKYEHINTFASNVGREEVSMKEFGGISKFFKTHPGIAAGMAKNLASALRDAIESKQKAQESNSPTKYKNMRYYSDIISDIVPPNLSSSETLRILEEVANSGHSIKGKTISGHSLHDLKHHDD